MPPVGKAQYLWGVGAIQRGAAALGLPPQLARLRRGVDIGGFVTSPARVSIIKGNSHSTLVEITIHEGKNRQVRKMFAAVGNPVQELERIAIGKIRLGHLKPGHYRKLTKEEIEYLKNC